MSLHDELRAALTALRDRGDITSGYDTAVECLDILARHPAPSVNPPATVTNPVTPAHGVTPADDERADLIDLIQEHQYCDIDVIADALLAAGYRKAPTINADSQEKLRVPSVEDVARVIRKYMAGVYTGADSRAIATAVLALLEGEK